MKISDIRASLQRLAERLDNQWAYARSDAEMDIAAGRAEYNDDGERLPTEPEISYYGMIAAFETLGGEWKRSSDGKQGSVFGIDNGRISKLWLSEYVGDPTSSMCKEAACYERGWEHRPDTPQAQAAVKQLIEKYN